MIKMKEENMMYPSTLSGTLDAFQSMTQNLETREELELIIT